LREGSLPAATTTLLTDNLTNPILWVHGGGDDHATLIAAGNVTNRGTLLLESTAGGYSETITIGGTLVNAPEGLIQVNPGSGGGRVFSTELINAGTMNLDYSASFGRAGANPVNTGGFSVAGATATITGTSFLNQNPGAMRGTGAFNVTGVSFLNNGTVSPGASPGTLSFTGNYVQGAAGRLNLELGGLTAGSQSDRLAVSGVATLDGLLSVTLINDFTPALSNVFTVLTCSSMNGQFQTFQGLTLFTNLALEPQSYATHLDLQVLAATNPPSAPAIMSQPQSLSVILGQMATFRVTANGTQPFAYQWLFNNSELAGATSASLVLANVQTNQAGLYALRITNAAGAALSSNALLTVRQITDLIVTDIAATNDAVAGQPLARTQAVILPGGLNGQYFIAVATDVTNAVPEDAFETNNTSVSTQFVTIRAPDLVVTSLNAPAAAQFGQGLNVSWVVQNAGTATATAPWNDRVYLSTVSNHLSGATLLLTAPAPGSLTPGASYTNAPTIQIPLSGASTPGAHYLVVFTDADGLFAEPGEADNLRSVPLALTLPPLPDLAVAQVTAPASAPPGQSIPVSWAVTNLGLAPAAGGWSEAVYLSNDTVSRTTRNPARLADGHDRYRP